MKGVASRIRPARDIRSARSFLHQAVRGRSSRLIERLKSPHCGHTHRARRGPQVWVRSVGVRPLGPIRLLNRAGIARVLGGARVCRGAGVCRGARVCCRARVCGARIATGLLGGTRIAGRRARVAAGRHPSRCGRTCRLPGGDRIGQPIMSSQTGVPVRQACRGKPAGAERKAQDRCAGDQGMLHRCHDFLRRLDA